MDNHSVNLFNSTISKLSRSLDFRSRKHEMILDNVANADTPNFKPFAMNVEEEMQRDVETRSSFRLQRTDERHLEDRQGFDDRIAATTRNSDPLLLRGDQNGVDIDLEMTALAKNSLLYKASAQIIASKFRGLKRVITGGSK
jgi:flagellar basal-body rod protein FlgB